MSGEITVTVPKWDYFQPKSIRERNPYWFRINKDMTNSSGLVGLSPAQKWAWVCLLGLCCSQDSKTIKFRPNRLACIANVDEKSILEMLEILKENHTIEFKTESTTFKTESTTPTIQNNTIQNNTTTFPQSLKNEASVTVWSSYSSSFKARYKVEPKRNATVNSQITNLIKRLGEEHAIEVVKFYVSHNDRWYVRQGHSIGICLKDCEKLFMEWSSGKKVTSVTAAATESMDHNASVVSNYLKKSEQREIEREVNESRILEASSDTRSNLPS
jgi:hypothetical protein